MTTAWRIRVAHEADTELLADFRCANPGVVWEEEAEEFIRKQLMMWALAPAAQEDDPRVLLTVGSSDGALLAVGAHERIMLRDEASGRALLASKIEVVAVATAWQGRRIGSSPGFEARVSDVVMSALLADIEARVPPRDARVMAVVHEQNVRSIAVCRRFGLTLDLGRPHPAYRRLITPPR